MRCIAPKAAWSAFLALVAGCGPQLVEPPSSGTQTGSGTVGDDATGGASAAMTTPATTGVPTTGVFTTSDPDGTGDDATFGGDDDPPLDDSAEGGDFIITPDVTCAPPNWPGTKASLGLQCDLFAQDCPTGSKCAPVGFCEATVWNGTTCAPLDPNPQQVGEPCTMQGSPSSGLDDCDIGLTCAFVDPDTLEGTCEDLCTGSEDDPICESDTDVCAELYDAAHLCLPGCNPLMDDCTDGTCIPAEGDFACVWDGADLQPGEACEYLDDCTAGAVCAATGLTGDCGDGFYCCTSVCDLNAPDPSAACLPGQECAPWYRPGTVMPPQDAIGVCTLPA